MSRKWVFIVLIAVVIVAVPVVLFLKQYYDNRYVLDDRFYSVVPLDYDITPYRDEQGDRVTDYTLTCYNADGEAREFSFTVLVDAHGSDLYPPGTYMRVDVSKQLVIGRRAVDEGSIPEKAKEGIAANFTPAFATSLEQYAEERTRQLAVQGTPAQTVSCIADGTTLVYAYTYSSAGKELAQKTVDFLDPVYSVQFRADKQAYPELTAIFLEIKLDDGTEIFSQKYDTRVEFDYEK